MENISKALLIAGGVLIGVLLLTVIVVMFSKGADFSSSYDSKREEEAIKSYNEPFTKLLAISDNDDIGKEGKITIYDIITVANYAQSINSDENANEIQIEFIGDGEYKLIPHGSDYTCETKNLEKQDQTVFHKLISAYNDSNINFKVSDIQYNGDGKVTYMKFEIR